MAPPKMAAAFWLAWLVVGALAGGCATSSTAQRADGHDDSETAEQPPDERAYREAAIRFLLYLKEQERAGGSIVQASGKDGIYPMYECMEHGCPDRVFCKKVDAYCHVTHCGKGSCYGCPEPFPEIFKNLVFKQWPQMSLDPVSEKAARIAAALNGLGHIAFGHPLEWVRDSKGDAKVREQFYQDATIVLDLVESDAGNQSPATRRPAECKAALSRFRDMVKSVDFDDAGSMATLKGYARQALEAFIGETLPETLPE
ncbi:hypothetical protein [Archangium sp.]|uniref:hypothetical protein n=1 Tax=Archangium sp. TaxID=1872627 RepID=UPI00286A9CD9|nr:hypothetical protein [Archangium sp.]